MNLISPLEAEELRRFFSSHSTAALGIKSPFGAQLERARLKLGRGTSSPDLADNLGQDVVDWLRVDRRLREAGAHPRRPGLTARRVLEAAHGPDESPEPVLPLYLGLGRVMLLTSAARGAGAEALRRADEAGRKGDRRKAAWLAEVRAEAEELVAWAEAAYAKTRPPAKERDERRVREARGERDRERRGHYAGRVDGAGRVFFATASAKKAMGCRR